MSERFTVTRRSGIAPQLVFSGTRERAVEWLERVPYPNLYVVTDEAGVKFYGDDFLVSTPTTPVATATVHLQTETVPHECLSVDLVRRIIRQEMESLLETLARGAGDSDGYETGELESAGLQAIKSVMERELHHLPHDWNCEKRGHSWVKCTCDIKGD